jgi:hypothetical protein
MYHVRSNAWHFEDVEMLVLELCQNMLNTLFVWVSAHHSTNRVTFAEFLISCSSTFSFCGHFCILLVY